MTDYVKDVSEFVSGSAVYDLDAHAVTPVPSGDVFTDQATYHGMASRFATLVDQWLGDTSLSSSLTEMVSHKAYLAIIGMGPPAVPLLLRELEERPTFWFAALEAIIGENPVPPEAQGDLQAMTEAWLEWGEQQGYE